jgi:hypothetical protein
MSGRSPRLAYARLRYSAAFDSECVIKRDGVPIHTEPVIPCLLEVRRDYTQYLEDQPLQIGGYLVSVPIQYHVVRGDYVYERGRVLEVVHSNQVKSYQVRTDFWAIEIGREEEVS